MVTLTIAKTRWKSKRLWAKGEEKMKIMGIDIGTTTVSVVLLEQKTGEVLERETVEHHSFLKGCVPEEKIQDPERIYEIVQSLIDKIEKKHGYPDRIGFTGQMHGMLYVDISGKAVSPLYTWQDRSGEILLENGKNCVQLLKETGTAAAGYGIVTHFYLQKVGRVPKNAVKMTTVSDYAAMRLCENTCPVIGVDMAASWGCFDLKKQEFLYEALERAGVDTSYLPEVRKGHFLAGKTKNGVPVMGSIGDNQASLFGSVRELKDTVLLNVGTGSQISFVTDCFVECSGSIELRPCTEDRYILVGSSLCGGRAYALLEQFYREAAGSEDGTGPVKNRYSRMQEQAEAFLEEYGEDAAWKVDTAFAGTRSDPSRRGEITGIGTENFHPGALTLGVIMGIIRELHEQYEQMCRLTGKRAVRLAGSGNGIRRNPLMKRLAEKMFGMPMYVSACEEEAAYGAALCAGKCPGEQVSFGDGGPGDARSDG